MRVTKLRVGEASEGIRRATRYAWVTARWKRTDKHDTSEVTRTFLEPRATNTDQICIYSNWIRVTRFTEQELHSVNPGNDGPGMNRQYVYQDIGHASAGFRARDMTRLDVFRRQRDQRSCALCLEIGDARYDRKVDGLREPIINNT